MRFFTIAAALCVAAFGCTGCAINGVGCLSGGCGSGVVSDCGCETSCEGGCEEGCGCDAAPAEASECACGGGGCSECSAYGDMTGMYSESGTSTGAYGGGLSHTSMAMPLFARGSSCGSGACRRVGSGQVKEKVVSASTGLIGRLKEANAIALAEQEADFEAHQGAVGCDGPGCEGPSRRALGCGAPGCGAGGCAECAKGIARHYLGQPYGRAVPHTTPTPGPGAGMAPTYAYPYYTTRGPRDFLAREPMSIGY